MNRVILAALLCFVAGSAKAQSYGGDLAAANNLSDLGSASTARVNLGLGTAATYNIGTATGTVPDAGVVNTALGTKLTASNNLSDVVSASTARGNLSAAAKGANSDITSLTGLTTALPASEGGCGTTSLSACVTALGVLSLAGGTMTGALNMGDQAFSGAASVLFYNANAFSRPGLSIISAPTATTSSVAQFTQAVFKASSTTSAGARMTADGNTAGSANCFNIPTNTVYRLQMAFVGISSGGSVSYTSAMKMGRASSATVTLGNTTVTAESGNAGLTGLVAPTVAADNTNSCLNLTTGYNTATTMDWAVYITSVEVQ